MPTPTRIFSIATVVALLALGPWSDRNLAAQTTIDFNDGTNLATIGTFYSALGVTFENASWDDFISVDEGLVGAGGLKLVADAPGRFQPKVGTPIVANFSVDIFSFAIRGLNVGANGARLVAYDMFGAVLATDEAFGIGVGGPNHPLLSASSSTAIRRIELYQPESNLTEGLLFDNMQFEQRQVVVPEPVTLILLGTGLFGVAVVANRRRRDAD